MLGSADGGRLSLEDNKFFVSASKFEFRVDDHNYVSQSTQGLEIASSQLELSASAIELSSEHASASFGVNREIVISGENGSESIALGGTNSHLMTYDNMNSYPGIFLSGSGDFRMGDEQDYLKFKEHIVKEKGEQKLLLQNLLSYLEKSKTEEFYASRLIKQLDIEEKNVHNKLNQVKKELSELLEDKKNSD